MKSKWRDILLGTPPDQITEAEKMRRLQDIADRQCALYRQRPSGPDEAIKHLQEMSALAEEENELDRRYPDVLPDKEGG